MTNRRGEGLSVAGFNLSHTTLEDLNEIAKKPPRTKFVSCRCITTEPTCLISDVVRGILNSAFQYTIIQNNMADSVVLLVCKVVIKIVTYKLKLKRISSFS
jgi:hypothetical protein